jgi:hypothetical protein
MSAGGGIEGLLDDNPSVRYTVASTPIRKASSKIYGSSTRTKHTPVSSQSPQDMGKDLLTAIQKVRTIETNQEALRVQAVETSAVLTQVKAIASAKGEDCDTIAEKENRKRKRIN